MLNLRSVDSIGKFERPYIIPCAEDLLGNVEI